MKCLDLAFQTPAENLACDELLLELSEEGKEGEECLRFWEPNQPFVVLGYSGRILAEVNVSACQKCSVPIHRRISGGGTVLQGPGCLNYALILNIKKRRSLASITRSYLYVLERHRRVIKHLTDKNIERAGLSDLALNGMKFSGNSERRGRNFVLIHGTFLLNADIALMERLLLIPEKQPIYRGNRSHEDFLTNLRISKEDIKKELVKTWNAAPDGFNLPIARLKHLAETKYSSRGWNFKY